MPQHSSLMALKKSSGLGMKTDKLSGVTSSKSNAFFVSKHIPLKDWEILCLKYHGIENNFYSFIFSVICK